MTDGLQGITRTILYRLAQELPTHEILIRTFWIYQPREVGSYRAVKGLMLIENEHYRLLISHDWQYYCAQKVEFFVSSSPNSTPDIRLEVAGLEPTPVEAVTTYFTIEEIVEAAKKLLEELNASYQQRRVNARTTLTYLNGLKLI